MDEDKRTARMFAPEGSQGASVEGVSYDATDGVVEVPMEAVDILLSHGFTMAYEIVEEGEAGQEEREEALPGLPTKKAKKKFRR